MEETVWNSCESIWSSKMEEEGSRFAVDFLRQPSRHIVDNPQEIAVLFANTFASVFIRDAAIDSGPY